MLDLVKGDQNNLEGSVIVYSLYKGDISRLLSNPIAVMSIPCLKHPEFIREFKSNPTFSLYSTPNLEDLVEKLNIPQEALDDFINVHRHNMVNNPFFASLSQPFYTGLLPPLPETDLHIFPKGDVLYTGSWTNPVSAIFAVQSGLILYIGRYDEQQLLKKQSSSQSKTLTVNNSASNQTTAPQKQITYKNLNEMPSDELQKYLFCHFISPMIDAKSKDDHNSFNGLYQKLSRLGEGTNLTPDIEGICTVLQQANTQQAAPLIQAYLSKMHAIRAEKFEEAAHWRDRIRILEERLHKNS